MKKGVLKIFFFKGSLFLSVYQSLSFNLENKVSLKLYLKRVSGTGVFLQILRIF